MKCLLIFLTICLFSSGLYADSTFVSGTIVSETWTPAGSPYCVIENIFVAGLTIEPGVKILFLGDYVFEVGGILTAVGTEQDSIKFTKADTVSGWQGVFFNFSVPGSEIAYCRVEGSVNSGVHIDNSSPLIRKCTITNNSGSQGGGINVIGTSSFTLESCTVSQNSVSSGNRSGGGIFVGSGDVILRNCIVNSNQVSGGAGSSIGGGIYVNGNLSLINCTFKSNTVYANGGDTGGSTTCLGGAIYVTGTATLLNCIIDNNSATAIASSSFNRTATARGGGLYVTITSSLLTNCIVSNNSVSASARNIVKGGGGVYSATDTSTITNCTIAFNTYQGLNSANDTAQVSNSILWENTSSQISGAVTVTYSDVQDGYPGVGNININPIFLSQDSLIIVIGSLCVDAGNPNTIYNDVCFPPSLGTERNDMGAHGGPGACGWVEPITGIEDEIIASVTQYYLEQNYPNPFNPSTSIQYAISSRQFVTMKVYDVLGNEIATLVNEEKPTGKYEVEFNATNLPSGIYFYRLQAGSFAKTKKMILMK